VKTFVQKHSLVGIQSMNNEARVFNK